MPNLSADTQEEYVGFFGTYELKSFLEEPEKAMDKATLIISRAGGTIVAEICAAGRPSLLVPFAASKENDQYYNALFMKNQNASLFLSEYHFNIDNLYKTICYLMDHKDELVEMARQAKLLSKPKAIEQIVEQILKD